MTVDVTSPGNYTPPAVDTGHRKNVVIAVNGSIRILPSQGRTIYTILRSYSEISIKMFRDDYDELDLSAFPEYRGLGDLPYESPPLRLLLSSRQSLVLENHRSFDLTAKSVIFSNEKDSSGSSSSSSVHKPVSGLIIFVISITVIISLVAGNMMYVKYFEGKYSWRIKKLKINSMDGDIGLDALENGDAALLAMMKKSQQDIELMESHQDVDKICVIPNDIPIPPDDPPPLPSVIDQDGPLITSSLFLIDRREIQETKSEVDVEPSLSEEDSEDDDDSDDSSWSLSRSSKSGRIGSIPIDRSSEEEDGDDHDRFSDSSDEGDIGSTPTDSSESKNKEEGAKEKEEEEEEDVDSSQQSSSATLSSLAE
jgi:hypothetical protein